MDTYELMPQACKDAGCIVTSTAHAETGMYDITHSTADGFVHPILAVKAFSPAATPKLITDWLVGLHPMAAPIDLAAAINGIETDVQRVLAEALGRSATWDHVLVIYREKLDGEHVAIGSTADTSLRADDAIAMCERAKFVAIVADLAEVQHRG